MCCKQRLRVLEMVREKEDRAPVDGIRRWGEKSGDWLRLR